MKMPERFADLIVVEGVVAAIEPKAFVVFLTKNFVYYIAFFVDFLVLFVAEKLRF